MALVTLPVPVRRLPPPWPSLSLLPVRLRRLARTARAGRRAQAADSSRRGGGVGGGDRESKAVQAIAIGTFAYYTISSLMYMNIYMLESLYFEMISDISDIISLIISFSFSHR